MFATKRRILEVITGNSPHVEEAPPAPATPEVLTSADIPTLKSASPRYAELCRRAAALRDDADRLRAELAETGDREKFLALEAQIAENARLQTPVNDEIRKEIAAASVLICAQVTPRHSELVQAIAKAALELHRANVQYTEFSAALDRRSIKWSRLKPAFPQFVGHPRDKQSPLARYLRQLVSDGFIERGSVPKELR